MLSEDPGADFERLLAAEGGVQVHVALHHSLVQGVRDAVRPAAQQEALRHLLLPRHRFRRDVQRG